MAILDVGHVCGSACDDDGAFHTCGIVTWLVTTEQDFTIFGHVPRHLLRLARLQNESVGFVMHGHVVTHLGHFSLVLPPFTTGELAMITHFVLAAFNFYAIFELIRISGPTYMSQANFLAVAFGVIFGMLIFGETHSLYVWGAMALTLAGVALVNLRRKKALG